MRSVEDTKWLVEWLRTQGIVKYKDPELEIEFAPVIGYPKVPTPQPGEDKGPTKDPLLDLLKNPQELIGPDEDENVKSEA